MPLRSISLIVLLAVSANASSYGSLSDPLGSSYGSHSGSSYGSHSGSSYDTTAPTIAPTEDEVVVDTTENEVVDDTTAPTIAPTIAPTEDEVVDEVVAPTSNPTFAPTEAATNPPLPEYVAANFDADSFTEVEDISSVTAPPTEAPTSPPTHAGYEIVEIEVEKKVLQVELTFAVSAEEAANPVMQKSLEAGFANAIGLDPSSVRVSSVGGVTVRRRLVDTAIEFEITSNSDDTAQADALKANVETAVTSGSVVANVQKEASINGVLTADLNTMVRALAAPTVTVATVIVTVATQQRAPTAAPTTAETEDSLSAASGAGSVSALAVALAILAAFPAL